MTRFGLGTRSRRDERDIAAFVKGSMQQPLDPDGQAMRSLNPFAYLACTNTLGNCLLFGEQAFYDPRESSVYTEAAASTDGALLRASLGEGLFRCRVNVSSNGKCSLIGQCDAREAEVDGGGGTEGGCCCWSGEGACAK